MTYEGNLLIEAQLEPKHPYINLHGKNGEEVLSITEEGIFYRKRLLTTDAEIIEGFGSFFRETGCLGFETRYYKEMKEKIKDLESEVKDLKETIKDMNEN